VSHALHDEQLPGYFRLFQGVEGGFVDMHETHGKLESRQNIPIALFLAARGERVHLLPVLDLRNVKSPDAARDGVEWEFKVPQGRTANAIDKALRDARRQAARVLIQVAEEFDRHLLEQAIHGRVRRAENILEVAVLLADVLYHFSRAEILGNTFRGKMY
jgi:nucleotide-binding universal stress UspA family protein